MALSQGVVGKRQDPFRGFKFNVDIIESQGSVLPAGGFSNVSGLTSETAVIEYREGTDESTMRKLPGLTTFEDLTLQKGKSFNSALQQWKNEVFLANSSNNVPDNVFRKNLAVDLNNSQNVPVKSWDILKSWATKIEHSDLDAGASDVVIETLTLANEGHIPRNLVNNQNNLLNDVARAAGAEFFATGSGVSIV